jgi:hypothetical protein
MYTKNKPENIRVVQLNTTIPSFSTQKIYVFIWSSPFPGDRHDFCDKRNVFSVSARQELLVWVRLCTFPHKELKEVENTEEIISSDTNPFFLWLLRGFLFVRKFDNANSVRTTNFKALFRKFLRLRLNVQIRLSRMNSVECWKLSKASADIIVAIIRGNV